MYAVAEMSSFEMEVATRSATVFQVVKFNPMSGVAGLISKVFSKVYWARSRANAELRSSMHGFRALVCVYVGYASAPGRPIVCRETKV